VKFSAVVVLTFRLAGRVNAVVVVVAVVVAVSCYFIDQMIEASYGGKWMYRTTRTHNFPPDIASSVKGGGGQVVSDVASMAKGRGFCICWSMVINIIL